MNCLFCNGEFEPKSKVHKCCSKGCKWRYEGIAKSKKPSTKSCKVCSSEFKPYTSLDKYCSMACRIENMKSKRSSRWSEESTNRRFGKSNPAFVHGLSVRGGPRVPLVKRTLFAKNREELRELQISEHGYHFCERCHASGSKIETHHIIFRSEKPYHEHIHDKRNLILVCVTCHNWYHKSKGNRDDLVIDRGLNVLFGNDVLNKKQLYQTA